MGSLTAYVDETVDDATSAMAVIAEEFSRGGVRLASSRSALPPTGSIATI